MTRMQKLLLAGVGYLFLHTPTVFAAEPFGDCPTQAFIVQTPGSLPIVYWGK